MQLPIQVWSSAERSGDTKVRVISLFKPMGLDGIALAGRTDGEEGAQRTECRASSMRGQGPQEEAAEISQTHH